MRNEAGQAILIVLLVMAVVLTVVLSILSRSVTDVTITSRGEESIRAFSAAEAGIEQGLILQGYSGSIAQPNFEGASFDANVDTIGENQPSFVYPLEVAAGDTATVWFVSHADDGSLVCDLSHPCFTGSSFKVCFGKPGAYTPTNTPAVEVSILYLRTAGNYSTAMIARATYDGNTGRTSTNKFDPASGGACTINNDKNFAYSATVNLGTGGLAIPSTIYNTQGLLQTATIRLLYNDQPQTLGIDTVSRVLPSQGKKVESTGVSGEATRKIQVLKLFADLPPVFQSVIYSPSGITK
ncbi:hypothetical protein HYT59_02825 [Candidatus Woesebacteria bacterium]|nr:hypothetical protein [Candidatus Woesebacteria bacterium]